MSVGSTKVAWWRGGSKQPPKNVQEKRVHSPNLVVANLVVVASNPTRKLGTIRKTCSSLYDPIKIYETCFKRMTRVNLTLSASWPTV